MMAQFYTGVTVLRKADIPPPLEREIDSDVKDSLMPPLQSSPRLPAIFATPFPSCVRAKWQLFVNINPSSHASGGPVGVSDQIPGAGNEYGPKISGLTGALSRNGSSEYAKLFDYTPDRFLCLRSCSKRGGRSQHFS